MPIQSSGAISLSNVRGEFGTTFSSLSNCYGIAASVPVSGSISLSNFYGKSASIPSITSPGTSNINTGSSSQFGSWELSNLVADIYGRPLTYVTSSFNASHFTTASNVGSKFFFSFPLNRFATSTPANITVINRFGRSNTISPSFTSIGYNIASSSLGSVTVSNNTVTYSLGSYFTDYSATGLGYTLTANPNGNASLSGSTLSVTGNNRGSTYTVSVSASNSYNQTASTSLSVTEPALPVVFSATGGTKSTFSTYTIHTYTSSGSFTVNSNVVCNIWIIGGGGGGGSFYCGGGGGGGAAKDFTTTVSAGTYTVTVGSGGSGGTSAGAGSSGGTSVISGIQSASGGGGGGGWNPSGGGSGGCGGGGGTNGPGSGGTADWGYSGASGRYNDGGINRGGGGGGMGGGGANTNGNPAGGSGITYNWGGSNLTVCGGGGGGTDNTTYGVGGSGVGGNGGQVHLNGGDATSYGSGGGGAGGGSSSRGGNGRDGIVIIRYVTPAGSPTTYTSTNHPGSSYISDFNILTFTPQTTSISRIDYNITYSKPNTGYGLDAISFSIFDTVTSTNVSGTTVNGPGIVWSGGSSSVVQTVNVSASLISGRTYALRMSWWSPGAQFTSISTNATVYYG